VFHEGMVALRNNNSHFFALADSSGKLMTPFVFDRIGDFSNGLAYAQINNSGGGKAGYIDNTGNWKVLLSPASLTCDGVATLSECFSFGREFKEGVARLYVQCYETPCSNGGDTILINTKGEVLFETKGTIGEFH